jgi:periplasmic protein TonB
MFSLLLLASVPATFGAAASGPAEGANDYVEASKNGEFLSRYYPEGAAKRGEQGKVTFQLTIEPDGSIGRCEVTESSGFRALDNETCDIMVRFARTKPVRNEDGRAIRAKQPGYIVWRLPEGATQVAATTALTMPKPEPLICKREAKTGSLVAKVKQCLTRTEWARQQREHQDEMDRLQGKGVCGGEAPCMPICPNLPGRAC